MQCCKNTMKPEDFIKSMTKKDGVLVIFDNDADGISSASLMVNCLKKLHGIEPYLISQPMPTDKNLISRVKTTLPTKIIIMDLAIDQQKQVAEKLSGMAPLIIIDHHQITNNINNKRILHYNPRFRNSHIYQSTTYLTYKICSNLCDMTNRLWITGIGMTGDYDLKDSQDLVKEVCKKYNVDKDLYKTEFGRLVDIISLANSSEIIKSENIVNIIVKAGSMEDVMKNESLINAYKIVQTEIAFLDSDIQASTEMHKNLVLYELKTKYNLRAFVSTKLSEMHHEKIVVVNQKKGSKVKLSGRNQLGVFNVAKVLQDSAASLKAGAGGHNNAAGGSVDVRDWDAYKLNLVEICRKLKNPIN